LDAIPRTHRHRILFKIGVRSRDKPAIGIFRKPGRKGLGQTSIGLTCILNSTTLLRGGKFATLFVKTWPILGQIYR